MKGELFPLEHFVFATQGDVVLGVGSYHLFLEAQEQRNLESLGFRDLSSMRCQVIQSGVKLIVNL